MSEVDVKSLKQELMHKKSGQKNLTLKELVELIDKHTVSKHTTDEHAKKPVDSDNQEEK